MRGVAWLLSFALLWTPWQSECYKILVYAPKFAHSHVNFMGGIADTLTTAGHDVALFAPEYFLEVKTNGSRLARIISRGLGPNEGVKEPIRHPLADSAWERRGENIGEMLKMIYLLTASQRNLTEILLTDDELLGRLRAEKFDVGISEVLSSSGFALFEKIGLRSYIAAFASTLAETITLGFGIDNNPSYVPGSMSPFSDDMTYRERASNLIMQLFSHAVVAHYAARMMPTYRKYARPDYDYVEVVSKSTFVFVNADEFLEFPRPINHKVVYIGGNAVPTPKPLNQEYQRIMESAVGGAVLISFGSIAKSSLMTNQTKNAFVNAFKAFPEVTFIWKYEEDDEVAADLPNVFKRKWVPQNDLLGHGNMRAFVSHGGLNSVTESVHSGVPIVCIPLFGDQMRNAKMVEKRGVAVIVDKMAINETTMVDAFKMILRNESYRAASHRLLSLIKNKPFSVRDRIVRHTEFAAEFGEVSNLDPVARKLNFFQYYLLDIFIPFFLLFFALLYISLRFCCFATKKLLRISKKKTD